MGWMRATDRGPGEMDGCWRMWGCGQSAAHRLDLDEEILGMQTEPWPWPTLVFAIVSVPQFPYLQHGITAMAPILSTL